MDTHMCTSVCSWTALKLFRINCEILNRIDRLIYKSFKIVFNIAFIIWSLFFFGFSQNKRRFIFQTTWLNLKNQIHFLFQTFKNVNMFVIFSILSAFLRKLKIEHIWLDFQRKDTCCVYINIIRIYSVGN